MRFYERLIKVFIKNWLADHILSDIHVALLFDALPMRVSSLSEYNPCMFLMKWEVALHQIHSSAILMSHQFICEVHYRSMSLVIFRKPNTRNRSRLAAGASVNVASAATGGRKRASTPMADRSTQGRIFPVLCLIPRSLNPRGESPIILHPT
jgi:hypothetical protein